VQIDASALPAAGNYLGSIHLESNGGNLDIPVEITHVRQAGIFQGLNIRTVKELAILLKKRSSEAIGWLQNGSVRRWYEENGWNYPIKRGIAPKLAGVQQFFEATGFARPPQVRISDTDVKVVCIFPEAVTRTIELRTPEKKWVYAFVESDALWLKPAEPVVAGPQGVEIRFEVDSGLMEQGTIAEGRLTVTANGEQYFTVNVRADVRNPH
jgi:hypothetical protein